MQNFVLDFAVGKVLEEKEFDQSQIRADWEVACMQLRVAAEHGFRPENRREAIYMASHLASGLVEESVSTLPAPLANALPMVKRNLPEVFSNATGLAEAVFNSFPKDLRSALKAIDSVLAQSFAFTDPDLDYKSSLIFLEPEVNWEQDKRPDWLTGQPVRTKCEIGVVMAKLGVTSADTPVLNHKDDTLEVMFQRADGSETELTPLEDAIVPSGRGEGVKRANERIEDMREAKLRLDEVRKVAEPKRPPIGLPRPPVPQAAAQGRPVTPPGMSIPGFRPRSYSPGLARWLTKVRMEEALAGEHPYAYAMNNPASLSDPSGLIPVRFEYNAFIPRRLGSLMYQGKTFVPAGLDFIRQFFTPWTHGHTDERGFTMSAAEARRSGRQAKIWAWATMDSEAIGFADPATSIKYGPSNALSTKSVPYRHGDGQGVVGLWVNIIRSGHERGKCISWAAFEIQACSPFIPPPLQNFQACINFIVYVRFLAINDRVHVTIEHSHDRFPDHEAFVFEPDFRSLLRYPTPYTEVTQGGLGQSTHPAIASCSIDAPTPQCKC